MGSATLRWAPRLPPENPFQMVTISDKQRPRPGGVRAAQCKNPTTSDKPQNITFRKGFSWVQIPSFAASIWTWKASASDASVLRGTVAHQAQWTLSAAGVQSLRTTRRTLMGHVALLCCPSFLDEGDGERGGAYVRDVVPA